MHLTRYSMYENIKKELGKPISGKILVVSGYEYFKKSIDVDASEIIEANYPDYDMQNLPFERETFDYVISDQVIEHLEDPLKAIEETNRVLKKGGLAVITSCFMNPYHPSPKDYWRFTTEAMRLIIEKTKMRVVSCDGWGNKYALLLICFSSRARRMEITKTSRMRKWIATLNQERYHIVTWVIAQREQ